MLPGRAARGRLMRIDLDRYAADVEAGAQRDETGIDRDDVLDLIAGLVEQSLLQVAHRQGRARYRLLDTIRAYARQRLSELEDRLSQPTSNNDLETSRVATEVRQGLQTQLDAITRAIRRYEKRSAAQTIQIEARFQEVDRRLKDALSLAAAAARTGPS